MWCLETRFGGGHDSAVLMILKVFSNLNDPVNFQLYFTYQLQPWNFIYKFLVLELLLAVSRYHSTAFRSTSCPHSFPLFSVRLWHCTKRRFHLISFCKIVLVNVGWGNSLQQFSPPCPRVPTFNLLIVLAVETKKRFISNIIKGSKENNMLVNTGTVIF